MPGELFCGAACGHIKQISTDGWETGSGGTFFGTGFDHIKQISTKGGGTWPGPGGTFFSALIDLTLTKARTPTAEAVRGKMFQKNQNTTLSLLFKNKSKLIRKTFRKLFLRFVCSKQILEKKRNETIRLVRTPSKSELSSRFFGL